MGNHTGAVAACQTQPHAPEEETLPLPSSEGIDRRLVVRYGVALLTGGYTALPTYAWVYYARLGVSEAEMVLITQLCTYWWTERAPHPGEAALAARMGKTVRTIQGYLRSLEAKGLLHIETRLSPNGQHQTNSYDLRPFFAAVEGLARLDGLLDGDAPATDGAPTAAPGSSPRAGDSRGRHVRPWGDTDACKSGPCDQNNDTHSDAERGLLCAGASSFGTDNRPKGGSSVAAEEGEGSCAGGAKNPSPQVNPIEKDLFDLDSIPPTPIEASPWTTSAPAITPHSAPLAPRRPELVGREGPATRRSPETRVYASAPAAPDGDALAAEVGALAAELGDDAPTSSVTRARNLQRAAGVPLDRFLRLLDEAAARTRDRQTSIVKRRRDGQAPNGMPYLFAVLQDLLHPAPPRMADVGPAPDRRRASPSGRRRRRADSYSRGEASGSYAAWSDSPAPLPIVEEHPVWRAVLDELAQVMTSENFNAWLASTRALDQEGDLLRVTVPNQFNKEWLERKLCGKVMGVLQKIDYDTLGTSRVGHVEYVVEVAV